MHEKPNRPPDVSTALQFPTDETIERLHAISREHSDNDVRLIAAILARLCPATEAIGKALPGLARGSYVSLDPDRHTESAER